MSAKNDFDKKIKSLIKAQRKVGSVTLAQLNSVLPDDMTSPDKIEAAIALIEDAGLDVVEDEKAQKGRKASKAADDSEDVDLTPDLDIAEPTEAELAAPVVDITEKIDDPVRMYLTQMGEIPLLTREEEISLARKIELTRKQFRKEVLSCGFGMKSAIDILEDVLKGELAFDRTLKVNQQDPEVGKADLSDRLPGNIQTLRRIYEAAREDFTELFQGEPSERAQLVLKRRIFSRRRKAVALIEELNLQGKKVRPMIDLVESRIAEMKRLQARLARYRGAQLQNPDAIETRPSSRSRCRSTASRRSNDSRSASTSCVWPTPTTRTPSASCRGQPAPRRVDREEVPQPRPVVPRPDPGGQHRPDEGGREVRVPPRLQVLDLRDVVDSPGDHAFDRRPGAHDPHPGAHDRDDVEAAQRLQEADPAEGPGAVDRGGRGAAQVSVDEAKRVMKISKHPISLDRPIGDSEDSYFGDFIEDESVESPVQSASREMLKERIENVLSTLTFREREIIKLRYGIGDGYTYTLEEVGRIFRVTRERVRQIEAKAVRKLQHPVRARRLGGFFDSAVGEQG